MFDEWLDYYFSWCVNFDRGSLKIYPALEDYCENILPFYWKKHISPYNMEVSFPFGRSRIYESTDSSGFFSYASSFWKRNHGYFPIKSVDSSLSSKHHQMLWSGWCMTDKLIIKCKSNMLRNGSHMSKQGAWFSTLKLNLFEPE